MSFVNIVPKMPYPAADDMPATDSAPTAAQFVAHAQMCHAVS